MATVHAQPTPPPPELQERVVPVDVTVNGTPSGIWPILERGGEFFAPIDAFQAWRIAFPGESAPAVYRGSAYLPLKSLLRTPADGLDTDSMILRLTAPASSFSGTRLTREADMLVPRVSRIAPALFGNYDFNVNQLGAGHSSDLGLLGEVGASGSWGVISQTVLGQRLGASDSRVFRLQSTYRRDFPEHGWTLLAGDGNSRTSLLGRPAYFAGLQFGSNFGLAPTQNRRPVPIVVGETATPSTIQLFVNDVLRQTSNVPAGPFTLANLPNLVGNGEVTVKVRDILGRETLITQPFLITADLLAPGLNDWSAEVGALRRQFGSTSNDYGEAFAAGLWRRGITNNLTLEGRLEAARDRQGYGVAAITPLAARWLLRTGAIASRDQVLGQGLRWIAGIERPSFGTSVNFSLEGASRTYRGLGEDRAFAPVQLQLASQASVSTGLGTFGFGLAVQQRFDASAITTVSANHSIVLGKNWRLSTYFTRSIAVNAGYSLGAVLSIPLDRQTIATASIQSTRLGADSTVAVAHTPDPGQSWAWRAIAGQQQRQARAEAGAYFLGRHGSASFETSTVGGQSTLRVGASGGLILAGGRSFAVQRFDSGAALVEVSGLPNIGVGLGGNPSTRTDAEGYALVSRLSAYANNPIRLDPNDLPLSAEVDSIELDVVPAWRSVAHVRFPIRSGRSALITVLLDDGEPTPPGATLRVVGDDREFLFARRGEAYVTGLKPKDRVRLTWRNRSCDIDIDLSDNVADIPRLGPLRCAGVPR